MPKYKTLKMKAQIKYQSFLSSCFRIFSLFLSKSNSFSALTILGKWCSVFLLFLLYLFPVPTLHCLFKKNAHTRKKFFLLQFAPYLPAFLTRFFALCASHFFAHTFGLRHFVSKRKEQKWEKGVSNKHKVFFAFLSRGNIKICNIILSFFSLSSSSHFLGINLPRFLCYVLFF